MRLPPLLLLAALLTPDGDDGVGWRPADTERVVAFDDVQIAPDGRRAGIAGRPILKQVQLGLG